MMIHYLACFGIYGAFVSRTRRKGKVGKGEQRAALTHSPTIKVLVAHLHLSSGVSLAHLNEFGARKLGELVTLKKIL